MTYNGKAIDEIINQINEETAKGRTVITQLFPKDYRYAGGGGGEEPFIGIGMKIPDELSSMAPHLEEFVKGMVAKLYANRHKEPPRKMDTLRFLMLLHNEIGELIKQCYEDRQNPNLFLELHDIANFAFLMGLSLRLEQQDESHRQAQAVPQPPRGPFKWLHLRRLWPQRPPPESSSS